MITYILIGLVVIVVLFLIVVASRPNTFRVERSAGISAPVPVVFAQVNELRKWEAWSPWARLDPNAKSTFEGPAAGVGAAMSWSGNNRVGEGRMAITESRPNELVRFQLDFFKPMKATNTAEFTFKSEPDRTTVTWAMFGRNNFMAKAFGLFVNCDTMIGGQFEKGLAQLGSVAVAANSDAR